MAKLSSAHFKLSYFQKSLDFLYPLVGFKKAMMFIPENTYLYCDKIDESILDYKLLVLFKYQEKKLFEEFEKNTIQKNPLLENCYLTEDGILYVFNLSSFNTTVDKFMDGKYSQFKKEDKDTIISFHGLVVNGKPVDPDKIARGELKIKSGTIYHVTGLYPEKFKDQFAKELKTEFDIYNSEEEAKQNIKDITELIQIFDLDKETLKTQILESKCDG